MKPVILVVMLALLTGCAWNSSPIHDGLSEEEMREQVLKHFSPGMSSSAAKQELDKLDLSWRFAEELKAGLCPNCGQHGYYANVMPFGLVRYSLFFYIGPIPTGYLRVWFNGQDSLCCVRYTPVDPTGKNPKSSWQFIP